jgi:hypothetical protein
MRTIMPDDKQSSGDPLSVQEMQAWLAEEIRDSAKAHELRTKGAAEFVAAYAAGKLTPEEAAERLIQHDRRWGESLYGATATPGLSDEDILRTIDEARDEMFGERTRNFVSQPRGNVNRSR